MKSRIGYLFWILMLAFGLMTLVVATQMLTNRNIEGLKQGNSEAAVTFTINNRLQDLVNLSFELDAKIATKSARIITRQSLIDSLAMLGYNASVLSNINQNDEVVIQFIKLNSFIDLQIKNSMQLLQEQEAKEVQTGPAAHNGNITDSIYTTALSIQKYLEQDLEKTLGNNTITSGQLSSYNRILAFIAIGAVLILGTIIINRHLRQVQLIKELEKATAAAKKSALIRDQFLANMSHEIRTPLNAIKGFSRLLSKTELNAEQQEYSVIINEASSNLMNIVNDILDISKIEAGKLRIEHKYFSLSKVLQTIEYLFLNAAREKGLEFYQKINPDIPDVLKGDPDRISQVLINLINNAIKFTDKGYIRTIISLEKVEEEKVWIRLNVQDSGIGIPARDQENIFLRFEQLHIGKDHVLQGTGLGLSIVKSLVTQMGGSITVNSEIGKGSLFSVLLPLTKVSDTDNEDKTDVDVLPPKHFTGAKILVVEDNIVNQLLLKHTLASFDIELDIVSNGQEAISAINKTFYDLVLLDIQMPVMDGYETIKIIRNKGFKFPVIAMTAFVLPDERGKCLEAGMNDYLAKPIDFNQLTSCLNFYLKDKIKMPDKNHLVNLGDDSFLLELSGGDKLMAARILTEIKDELPAARSKLINLLEKVEINAIRKTCHYLLSTFSPLGSDAEVMRKLEQLKNAQEGINEREMNITLINNLIKEIAMLESELTGTLKDVSQ